MIAYEYPPSAGGGVQRVMKLARYLPEFGWQPYVLSATPVPGTPVDGSLLAEVSHVDARYLPDRNVAATIARAIAPLKRARRQPASGGPAAAGVDLGRAAVRAPVSTRLARHFFIDSAEVWSRSVPSAAVRWSREVAFDAVIASGPPHSALVAGARAARMLGVGYVVDLRDAWAGNLGYTWPEASRQQVRSRALQKGVLEAADAVVAVSEPIAAEARETGAAETVVVPNGFDPADLPLWAPAPGPLRVAFMGRFYGTTDPTVFFDGVARYVERSGSSAGDLCIDAVGPDSPFVRAIVAERGLGDIVTYHGFKPHAEALGIVARADVGLVVLTDHPGAEAIYTSKLFEYLGIGMPVLFVGPERGVAARLIEEADGGTVVANDSPDRIAAELDRMAAAKAAGTFSHSPREDVLARYHRRSQAGAVAEVLTGVTGGRDV